MQLDEDTTIDLPIQEPELVESFNKLEQDFRKLSETILYTLRNEIRCHTIYYLDLAIREVIFRVLFLTQCREIIQAKRKKKLGQIHM